MFYFKLIHHAGKRLNYSDSPVQVISLYTINYVQSVVYYIYNWKLRLKFIMYYVNRIYCDLISNKIKFDGKEKKIQKLFVLI